MCEILASSTAHREGTPKDDHGRQPNAGCDLLDGQRIWDLSDHQTINVLEICGGIAVNVRLTLLRSSKAKCYTGCRADGDLLLSQRPIAAVRAEVEH